MKKVKNPINNDVKNTNSSQNDLNPKINMTDKINIVLGDKVKELQNTLKMKKEQNNQLLLQIQNLIDKSNELVSKRNNLLTNINQQKSLIFIIKNKNKGYRNYLSELTSKDSSEFSKNKKDDDVFNSIAKLSENISGNIIEINSILSDNGDKLKLNNNELLKNIPVDFLKNLLKRNVVNK